MPDISTMVQRDAPNRNGGNGGNGGAGGKAKGHGTHGGHRVKSSGAPLGDLIELDAEDPCRKRIQGALFRMGNQDTDRRLWDGAADEGW